MRKPNMVDVIIAEIVAIVLVLIVKIRGAIYIVAISMYNNLDSNSQPGQKS